MDGLLRKKKMSDMYVVKLVVCSTCNFTSLSKTRALFCPNCNEASLSVRSSVDVDSVISSLENTVKDSNLK